MLDEAEDEDVDPVDEEEGCVVVVPEDVLPEAGVVEDVEVLPELDPVLDVVFAGAVVVEPELVPDDVPVDVGLEPNPPTMPFPIVSDILIPPMSSRHRKAC